MITSQFLRPRDSTVSNDQAGWVRIIANAIQLVGYFLLIHNTFVVGLAIKALSDLMIMYWAWRNNLWDVVIVTGIFGLMNSERLLELVLV